MRKRLQSCEGRASYLDHILKCLARLEAEAAKGEAVFRTDQTVQDAVLMNLAVIGEAVKRLSGETRALAREVPWRQVMRLRDIIIHHYDRVDLNQIWDTVRLDVLPFRSQIEGLRSALDELADD